MRCLIELHYLPCLEYFCALLQYQEALIERHEHYVKQTYRTRCYINGPNGVIQLTVPVTEKHGKVPIKDIKIDDKTKWQNNHWRTLVSSYRKSPFFEHYADGIEHILFRTHTFLFDLNAELLSFCLQSMGSKISISETVSYHADAPSDVKDLRSLITPKRSYAERPFYHPAEYPQVFGNKFAANLSLVDLIFCEGPNTLNVIKSTTRGYLNN
jgi:hypothetical protein